LRRDALVLQSLPLKELSAVALAAVQPDDTCAGALHGSLKVTKRTSSCTKHAAFEHSVVSGFSQAMVGGHPYIWNIVRGM